MTVFGSSGVQTVDWTEAPPTVSSVVNSTFDATGSTGAGFDGCADLVFYVAHTGSSNQDNLNIYAPDGTELLTSNTANGPGFNAVRFAKQPAGEQITDRFHEPRSNPELRRRINPGSREDPHALV